MKIVNMLPVLAFGDAVGNDTIAVCSSLKNAGYESIIAAAAIDDRLAKDTAIRADDLSFIKPEDVVIYHLSTGHELNRRFAKLNCRKIIKYHNITPPEFFYGYNCEAMKNCVEGYREAGALSDAPQLAFADSQYNKEQLQRMGYACEIDVLPILIPFEDYQKTPDENLVKRLDDGYTNIIFTGRVVPNKRQEDVIAAFYYYKKYYNPKSRLILVGNYNGMETYYESLRAYVDALQLTDVIFTGHIKFPEILAYYRSADLFLCMSDHEGFCVPLIEAMLFDVPVIAKDTSAIADTLGGSGVLLPDKEPRIAAAMMNKVMTDEAVKEKILTNQRERLQHFDHEKVEKQLLCRIGEFINHEEGIKG